MQIAKSISLKYHVISNQTSFLGVVRKMIEQNDEDDMDTIEIQSIRTVSKRMETPNALYNLHV